MEATWEFFAKKYSLDLSEVLKSTSAAQGVRVLMLTEASHGVRTTDNLRRWCGLSEPADLQVRRFFSSTGRPLIFRPLRSSSKQ